MFDENKSSLKFTKDRCNLPYASILITYDYKKIKGQDLYRFNDNCLGSEHCFKTYFDTYTGFYPELITISYHEDAIFDNGSPIHKRYKSDVSKLNSNGLQYINFDKNNMFLILMENLYMLDLMILT